MSTRRKGLKNAYVRGTDTLAHSLKMLVSSVLFSLLLSVSIGSVFGIGKWYRDTSPYTRAWTWSLMQAITWDAFGYHFHLVEFPVDDTLATARLPARDIRFAPNVDAFEASIQREAWACLRVGLLVTVPAFALMLGLGVWRGIKQARDERLRGGELATARQVARRVRRAGASRGLKLGEVPMPEGSETQHMLITGRPGVGKSVLISSLLDAVRERGDRAVIYDRAGEFTRHFFRAGDTVLNPFDSRAPGWSPWSECARETDYYRLASSIIPQQGNDPYWSDAARSLFASALLSLAEAGRKDLPELLRLCLSSDLKELAAAVAGTEAESLLSEENAKMALSVRATMTAYLRSLLLLPSEVRSMFSLREWVSEGKGWVFITSRADQHDAIRPLISTWMDSAVAGMLSLPPDRKRRVWLILDELPSLQKLPSLMPGMAEGRKHGLCVVQGIQTVAQLRALYGRDEAEALLGLPGTQCHFAAGDPETAEWISKALLSQEISETSEDMTYSAMDIKDSVRLSDRRTEKRLVMPAEVLALEKLHFYLRLPGEFPVCKTRARIVERRAVAEAFRVADGPTIGDLLRKASQRREAKPRADAAGGEDGGEPRGQADARGLEIV